MYQKALLHTLFCLFLKSVESLQCIIKATAQYIFERHAPLKEKQVTFENKNYRKAIMTTSRLLNKFRQDRNYIITCRRSQLC